MTYFAYNVHFFLKVKTFLLQYWFYFLFPSCNLMITSVSWPISTKWLWHSHLIMLNLQIYWGTLWLLPKLNFWSLNITCFPICFHIFWIWFLPLLFTLQWTGLKFLAITFISNYFSYICEWFVSPFWHCSLLG